MGTVVYSDLWAGVFTGMAPDGWADECWFRLIDGGVNYVLDSVPGGVVSHQPAFARQLSEALAVLLTRAASRSAAGQEVLVRSIDLMASSHNKALIWQTGFVGNGTAPGHGGALVVSGLNLLVNDFAAGAGVEVPEAAWLLHNMISTAATAPPKPKTQLQLKFTECPGCLPPVNANRE